MVLNVGTDVIKMFSHDSWNCLAGAVQNRSFRAYQILFLITFHALLREQPTAHQKLSRSVQSRDGLRSFRTYEHLPEKRRWKTLTK